MLQVWRQTVLAILLYWHDHVQYTRKSLTSCNKLSSQSACPKLSTSLEQTVNNLEQPCWYYQTCCKVVPTSLIQSWHNNIVTTLCHQHCNILVYHDCIRLNCSNNLVTNLIMPSSLLQVVNSLFQTCYNNWEQAVWTQLVDSLWTDL
jgi:hypothetical protein